MVQPFLRHISHCTWTGSTSPTWAFQQFGSNTENWAFILLVTPLQWAMGHWETLKLLSNLKVRLLGWHFPASLTGSTCAVSIMPARITGGGRWWASAPSALLLLARSSQSEQKLWTQAENPDFTWCGPRAETQGVQCSVTNMSTYNKTPRRVGGTLQEAHRKNGLICTIQQQTYSGLKSLCQKNMYANGAGGNDNWPWAAVGKLKKLSGGKESHSLEDDWTPEHQRFHLRSPSIATRSDVQIARCVLSPRTWPAIWLGFKGNSSCWEPAVAPWSQHPWHLGEQGAPGAPLVSLWGPTLLTGVLFWSSCSESWTSPAAGGSQETQMCAAPPASWKLVIFTDCI